MIDEKAEAAARRIYTKMPPLVRPKPSTAGGAGQTSATTARPVPTPTVRQVAPVRRK